MVLQRLQIIAAVITALILHLSLHVQSARNPRDANEMTLLDLSIESSVHDFDTIVREYKNASTSNWRLQNDWNLDVSSPIFNYMLANSKLTDSIFTVGPDENTEEIRAHSMILAAASPVFEAAFQKKPYFFRLKDWQQSAFKKILGFIYTGKVCFADFDEACTMLKHASSLEINSLKDSARSYITASIHPDRLWETLSCARKANDKTLVDHVFLFISKRASAEVKKSTFEDTSEEDIADLLQRDNLNVASEVDLYDAVTRWGLAQVKKSGLRPSPEKIRSAIGPKIFKGIRFLTMTEEEFSRLRQDDILDYEESIAVRQNIKSPGIVPLPETLSNNTSKRKATSVEPPVRRMNRVKENACEWKETLLTSTNILETITDIPFDSMRMIGLQIPKSIEAINDVSVIEHFTIYILDPDYKAIYSYSYNQVPPQRALRFVYKNSVAEKTYVQDEKLITIKINPRFSLPAICAPKRCKVKVVFHGDRKYPAFVDAGLAIANTKSASSDSGWTIGGQFDAYHTLHNRHFVYSIIQY